MSPTFHLCCACRVEPRSQSLRTVSWSAGREGPGVTLRIVRAAQGDEREADITLAVGGKTVYRLRARDGSGPLSGRLTFAEAIRVTGSVAPQVLIRFDQGNLTTYEIYRIDGRKIRRAFSYSTRYEDSVRWTAGMPGLSSIEVLDRLAVPEDERLSRDRLRGRVWVRHRLYSVSMGGAWRRTLDRGELCDLARGTGWRVVGRGTVGWFGFR